MILHEPAISFLISGENLRDICGHLLDIVSRLDRRFLVPGQTGHGIKLHKIHVVITATPGLREDFV